MLNQLRDRQMEIVQNRVKDEILKQAQQRYDRAPVLETKRFCGACARRPKSAKASTQVTVGGVIWPPKLARETSSCHRLTFSTYEQRESPPKPLLSRRKSYSTQVVNKSALFEDTPCLSPDDAVSRSIPSPVEGPLSRPMSPLRSYDSSVIPDRRHVPIKRAKTARVRTRLVMSARPKLQS